MPRRKAALLRPPAKLPKTDSAVIDAIKDHIMTKYDALRPPEVSAAVLALIVELERQDLPFPNRQDVARNFRCSVFGLDAALATALSREMIELEVRVIPGAIKARFGVKHERYFHPSKELMSIARRAMRQAA